MYMIGYFLMAVAKVLDLALSLYMWVVVARAILSWVNPDPYNAIVRFIHSVTEPVLVQIRSRIPASFGGIDFSPKPRPEVGFTMTKYLTVRSQFEIGASVTYSGYELQTKMTADYSRIRRVRRY